MTGPGKSHGQTKRHHCVYGGPGCQREATCLPRLYVPASRLSQNRDLGDYSAAMFGFYLCETCFKRLTAKEILQGDRGEPIRAAISQWFRERNAHPNFDAAVIGRISGRESEFGMSEDVMERRRAN